MQQHFYQKTNLIKIINIRINNAIFVNYIAYKNKPVLYNHKIFNQNSLIVNSLSKLYTKQWLLSYKIFYLL